MNAGTMRTRRISTGFGLATLIFACAAPPAIAQTRTGPYLPGRTSAVGGVRMQMPRVYRPAPTYRSTSRSTPYNSPSRFTYARTSAAIASANTTIANRSIDFTGNFRTDDLGIKFDSGCDLGHSNCTTTCYPRSPYWWPYYYGYYGNRYYSSPVVQGPYPVFYSVPTNATPQQTATEAPPPPAPIELITRLLAADNAEDAVRLAREALRADAENAELMRALAIALIEDKRLKEGIAVMGLAYQTAPNLAFAPLTSQPFAGDQRRMRDAVVRCVTYAHRSNSPSAWVTVTVLMQGEGRDEPARRMLERAQTKGLTDEVAVPLRQALSAG